MGHTQYSQKKKHISHHAINRKRDKGRKSKYAKNKSFRAQEIVFSESDRLVMKLKYRNKLRMKAGDPGSLIFPKNTYVGGLRHVSWSLEGEKDIRLALILNVKGLEW